MKKLFISLSLILGIISTPKLSAQSFQFGTVVADAGVGFGLYGIRAYSPINQMEHTGIGGVGTLPSVDAEFGLLRLIGVGVHYRRGTYGPYSNGKIRGTTCWQLCLIVFESLATHAAKLCLLTSSRPKALQLSVFAKKGSIYTFLK